MAHQLVSDQTLALAHSIWLLTSLTSLSQNTRCHLELWQIAFLGDSTTFGSSYLHQPSTVLIKNNIVQFIPIKQIEGFQILLCYNVIALKVSPIAY